MRYNPVGKNIHLTSMPADSTQILCTDCDFKHVIDHRPVSLAYNFPNTQRWTTGRKFGWCYHCDGIHDMEPEIKVEEVQPRLDSLQATMNTFSYKLSVFLSRFTGERLKEPAQLRDLKNQLELARHRHSAPRCLSYGKEGAVPLWDDKNGQLHHSCGGQFYSKAQQKKSQAPTVEREFIHLDLEGKRLDRHVSKD